MSRLPIVVCGSMAYDTIMVFPDRFRNHILPDHIHLLNVAFHVPELRREFGGCAGNIAYGLALLGVEPIIVAAMGHDAEPYLKRLQALGLRDDGIAIFGDQHTAQAFIITDLDDNQITAFHPGAMEQAHANSIDPGWEAAWGVVSPDGHAAMCAHCEALFEAEIPFLFDPGQALPLFSGTELARCLELACACVVNDYEAQLLCDKTGWSLERVAEEVEALIVTRGGEGADLYLEGRCKRIPAVPAKQLIDPTGCGDAFRAGLLAAKASGADWQTAVQVGAAMGAHKIAHPGGQNYTVSRAEIAATVRATYGTHWA